jgi:DNA-binding XRE family transcriptional regulator
MSDTIDGRQLTAARALARLTVRQMADLASTTKRVICELETRGAFSITETRKKGAVTRALWERIVAVLADAGVEIVAEGRGHGSGARWRQPREARLAERIAAEGDAGMTRGDDVALPEKVWEAIETGTSAVKVLREHRAITQQALAAAVGVTQAYIAAIEASTRTRRPSVLNALARALGVPVDVLMHR